MKTPACSLALMHEFFGMGAVVDKAKEAQRVAAAGRQSQRVGRAARR